MPDIHKIVYRIARTRDKEHFLAYLSRDLRRVGSRVLFKRVNGTILFAAQVKKLSPRANVSQMRKLREKQAAGASEFFKTMKSMGIKESFTDEDSLGVSSITPIVRICRSPQELMIYRYCAFMQSIPNSRRVGRQIRALVYDIGQTNPKLMGAIGLASGVYTLGCRDRYLGWKGVKARSLKTKGLKHIMDLSLCISFLPYSKLFGGKLMAMLAMSDVIQKEFKRKYRTNLLGIVTTCATGTHCPIFNRIMIREGGLYRKIGMTAGYTASFFSSETLKSARQLIRGKGSEKKNEFSISAKPIRTMRTALERCGLAREPLLQLGSPKGVYLGISSDRNLEGLRTGKYQIVNCLTVENIAKYWKAYLLPKRKDILPWRPGEIQ